MARLFGHSLVSFSHFGMVLVGFWDAEVEISSMGVLDRFGTSTSLH